MARPEITEPNINPLPLKRGRIHFEKNKLTGKKIFLCSSELFVGIPTVLLTVMHVKAMETAIILYL